MPSIELLGRLLCLQEKHVLLARFRGASHTFLPGGHIEFNEGSKKAIVREIDEEISDHAAIDDFVCVIEHSYNEKNTVHYEINLIFSGSLKHNHFPKNPVSMEKQLEFFWHPIEKLDEANLMPKPLREVILEIDQNKPHPNHISTLPLAM